MRKVVTSLFISLDGVTEEPSDWQFDFDDEMMAHMQARIASSDAILLGRVTYDYWAPYWPTAEYEPFASYINKTPKYVVSTTLDKVEWQNSTLIQGHLADALTQLKAQPGQNIAVEGSPSLVEYLLQHDLLDELTLMVHPVVAGKGKRFFTDGANLKRLTLISNTTTRSGVALLTYQRREV